MPLDAPHHIELLRDLVANNGAAWVTVAGDSMKPTLQMGEQVQITRCASIRRGDVVLFESHDRRDVILHRVIAPLPCTGWFLHAGDGGLPTRPSIANTRAVIGRANVPRRRSSLRTYMAAVRRLIVGSPS